MKTISFVALLGMVMVDAQTIEKKLSTATQELLGSAPAFSANLSFYVADDRGNMIYDYQGNKGLTTASTQKIFTAAMALELLGKDYRWLTTASYSGEIKNGHLQGNLFLHSNGDPTLGSWRYEGFKPDDFQKQLVSAIKNKGITSISGDLIIDDGYFDFQTLPGGWAWNDIGNYYGAGVWGVNWRENQFDIKTNGKEIKGFNVDLQNLQWVNDVQTGGTSDQSVIYTAPHSNVGYISGFLPAKNMTISGAMPNPPLQLGAELKSWLVANGIHFSGNILTASQQRIDNKTMEQYPKENIFWEYPSPTLDKVVHWFMRKSVNLYGETLVKTMAREQSGEGSYKAGMTLMKDFWKSKGIHPNTINFADGSGLSPKNYVSAKAEVQALLYAQKQSWFPIFLESFPTQNKMKMKSGTMSNTKSFAGYHTSAEGKRYVFAIIINNYQGAGVSEALYKVLNVLK